MSIWAQPDQQYPWSTAPTLGPVGMQTLAQMPTEDAAPLTDQLKPIAAPQSPAFNAIPKGDPHANLPPVFAPMPDPIKEQTGHLQGQLENDYKKDADPYGSPDNHPGFFGKFLHGLSHATGGDTRRQWEEQSLGQRLSALATEQSQNEERGANTAHVNAETPEVAPNAESTRSLQGAQKENLESETEHRGDPASPEMALYRSLVSIGYSPSESMQEVEKDKAMALKPPTGEHVNLTLKGKPAIGTYHPDTGKTTDSAGNTIDNPEPYERPQVTNINAGLTALDRESKQFGAPHAKGVTDADTQLEKIADARTMINGNAEAQALGIPKVLTALVSGAGSGVRITQPELNAIGTARGLGGDVQGTLNSWAGKGKLTATQQKQLTGLLDAVKQRITEKQAIHSQALDTINSGSDRKSIVQADKEARQKLSDLERAGHYAGQQVQLKNGTTITVQHVHPDGSFD